VRSTSSKATFSGALNDPTMKGMKVKKGTGKRLSPAERAKQKKQREKLKRQMKRNKK